MRARLAHRNVVKSRFTDYDTDCLQKRELCVYSSVSGSSSYTVGLGADVAGRERGSDSDSLSLVR